MDAEKLCKEAYWLGREATDVYLFEEWLDKKVRR